MKQIDDMADYQLCILFMRKNAYISQVNNSLLSKRFLDCLDVNDSVYNFIQIIKLRFIKHMIS